jgi:HK97 family phage portal protein
MLGPILLRAASAITRIWGPWRATYDPPISLNVGQTTFPAAAAAGSAWTQTYADLYRREPAVRTCIDFLARNIAQVGVHLFRRLKDDSRIRERDHPAARLLAHPNPLETAYTFLERTVQDLGIYGAAAWVQVQRPGGPLELYEVPRPRLAVRVDAGGRVYDVTWPDGRVETVPRDRLVLFAFYDPSGGLGLSPLETLRPLLAQSRAALRYQEYFFRNGSRMSGVIERPAGAGAAGRWTPEQKAQFIEDWHAQYSGADAAGRTAILEDGMTYKGISYSAEQSQLVETQKLAREQVAALFHIPLTMVGNLEHATFSNMGEQHKQLYQDCLGPWFAMLEQEINRGILAGFTDSANLYAEFNIAEKLQGSFEEQGQALRATCGAPPMTINEGRARLNLPRIDDPIYDRPILPLNTDVGQAEAARAEAVAAADAPRVH